MMAGYLTLYGGVAVLLLGAAALARYCWLACHKAELSRQRFWLSTLGCVLLFLSNFAAAGGIIATVIDIETRYRVVIRNASGLSLSGVRVSGGGCETDLGTIKPGGVARRSFSIQHDGTLQFRAVSGTAAYTKTIDDYVTNGVGGKTTVTVNLNGTISVSSKGK